MNEALETLKLLEASMVEAGVSEEYGSWLLTVRYAIALLEDEQDNETAS